MKKAVVPIAFIAGVGSGWVAGTLMAPHKGSITRAKLKNSMDSGKERMEEKAQDLRSKAYRRLRSDSDES